MRECKDGRKQCGEGGREDERVKDRLLGEEGQKRILEQQVMEEETIEASKEKGASGMETGKEIEEVEDVMAAFLEALSGEHFKTPKQRVDNIEEEMEVEKESISADVGGEESQLVRKGDKRKGRPSKKRKPETVLKLSFSEESSSTDSQDGIEMDNARPLFQLTEEMDVKGKEEREEETSGCRATPVNWADLVVSESEATSLEGQEMEGTLKKLLADVEALVGERSSSSAKRTVHAEEASEDNGRWTVERNGESQKQREKSAVAEEQLIEVSSGVAGEPIKRGEVNFPQFKEPPKFSWSQLEAPDSITAGQSGGGDSKMEISGGRGRRRAVENDDNGEEGRERKCTKLEAAKTLFSLEDLIGLQDEKGDNWEWGESEEDGEEDSQDWSDVVEKKAL
ncbi:hypothetical protein G5714_022115 [Onychostoma macrolepis]|uniref:Uncharacterized protein n=1 Tax=Onychostoma macrolepis TaxID=369639 RepID=A0A7J6BSY4_9TELE|nr:hypothetical protein G5714_022115 [Onychostoma macrolepis]